MQSVPLAERHRRWLEEEVHFLSSKRERASFLALDGDEARDRFMAAFWNRRDPTPGTSRNEFRDQHEVRLEEADRLFTVLETRPGRLTERGRAYQLLGPPQSREGFSHAGDRLSPLELWHYWGRQEAFLPESFYLIFFRPDGHGDYRLWSPARDGVAALVLHREPGRFLLDERAAQEELRSVDIELARAVRSLVSGDGGDAFLTGESLRVDIENYAEMAERYRGLEERVRARTSFRPLVVASTAAVLYDATGVPQVHYALELPSSEVRWREEGSRFRASFGIACRMMEPSGKLLDAFEDWIDLDVSKEERSSLRGQALSFQGRLILPTGRYRLDFALVSVPASASGEASLTVDVPDAASALPSSARVVSPILLARSRRGVGRRFVDRLPFQVGTVVLNPSPNGVFPATEALAYVQLAGVPEGATLVWSLAAGDERGHVVWREENEVGSAPTGPGGVLSVEQIVPLWDVPEGVYRLEVELSGLPLQSRESDITVEHGAEPRPLRVFSRESLPAGDGRIRSRRGALFARIGDRERAIGELAAASRLRPRDLEVRLNLAVMLFAAERYVEVIDTLQPLAPHYPSQSDVLVLLGYACLKTGDAEKAVSYLKKAVGLRPADHRLKTALAQARELEGSVLPK